MASRNLLTTVGTPAVTDYNYVSYTGNGSYDTWNITHQDIEKFWVGYCDLVATGEQLSIAERPTTVLPVIAEFTFKFDVDLVDGETENWEPFNDLFLQRIVYIYQRLIEEHFQIADPNLCFICVILESEEAYMEKSQNGDKIVIELRLQFPFCQVESSVQTKFIRTKAIQALRNNNVISELQKQPIGDWEDILAADTCTKPICLYGSTKYDRPRLVLNHIWPQILLGSIEDRTLPPSYELEDVFLPINHSAVQNNSIRRVVISAHNETHWLPMFLSLYHYVEVVLLKSANKEEPDYKVSDSRQGSNQIVDHTPLEMAQIFLTMLNSGRYYRESTWQDIGKALYHASNGEAAGLTLWIKRTEQHINNNKPTFLSEVDLVTQKQVSISQLCHELYYTFANTTITVETLAWYAKEDNPIKYATWHDNWCNGAMENALSGLDTDLAEAFYRLNWLDYRCTSYGGEIWWVFSDHRWTTTDKGVKLRKNISGPFMRKFIERRATLASQVAGPGATDKYFVEKCEIAIKRIAVVIQKLKTISCKNGILRAISELFHTERFLAILDRNPELTGVTNGVLEIVGDRIVHRAAKPEDYISLCTGVPYHTHFTFDHPLVDELTRWFGQTFVDEDVRHYFLKFAASCLRGKNSDKILSIWTGETGDNSKSMTVKLFESTFGPYCIKFPITMLTAKGGNPSGPAPQLARAKCTRVAFLDEPDDTPMDKSIIKRYTGGDSFFARLLHDNGGDIVATFKLILMCNKVPIIPDPDEPVKNRTKLIPYLSKWVKNPPASIEERYKQRLFELIPNFEKRVPILAPAFLWLMTMYYPYYANEGLIEPDIIKDYTNNFFRNNDIYAQFIDDRIIKITAKEDQLTGISATRLYTAFKLWYKEGFPGAKIPERGQVRNEFVKRWGKPRDGFWYGFAIGSEERSLDMSTSLGGNAAGQLSAEELKIAMV